MHRREVHFPGNVLMQLMQFRTGEETATYKKCFNVINAVKGAVGFTVYTMVVTSKMIYC